MPSHSSPVAAEAIPPGFVPVPARVGSALARRLAVFIERRLHTAAIRLLRHVEDRLPGAAGAERADLEARAEALRRSLR